MRKFITISIHVMYPQSKYTINSEKSSYHLPYVLSMIMVYSHFVIVDCWVSDALFVFSKIMPGQQMKYPYTIAGKFMRTPWKEMFQKGRGFRYWVFSLIVVSPVFFKLSSIRKCVMQWNMTCLVHNMLIYLVCKWDINLNNKFSDFCHSSFVRY